ncbi:hypothetical protein F5X96DRAFT_683944 [Biscogniauxia mediterranea]|nr:hypothetical protein F5X96DRAFT_683944 [Biscogniauxia mediterranea]
MLLPCSHWIWSSEGEAPGIAGSRRLDDLTSSLPPQDPAPSLVLMIGCRQRPAVCRRSKRQLSGICLDFHNDGELPLLLGTAVLQEQKTKFSCCRSARECFPPTCVFQAEADAAIYSQLLYPFVDVFCFYAYTLRDLECISKHLAVLIQIGQPTPRFGHPPKILILLVGHQWVDREIPIEQDFDSFVGENCALNSYFSKVSFLQLPDAGRGLAIPPFLIDHVQIVRQKRREASALFVVQHLNTLFDRAFDTVSSFPGTSFDCLLAARRDFPVDPDMATHLENFVTQVPVASQLRTFAVPVVASSILLDQYPPQMHFFKPAEVYQKLYSKICLQVGRTAFRKGRIGGLLLPSVFCSLVLANLESLFTQLVNGQSAKSIHEAVLAKYAAEWRGIRSSRSCFTCFASAPQHVMQCGHAICDNCVQVFGQSEAPDPWLFRFCKSGHGILCIDGGGVGGIIPSTILELIQDRLDLPIPIQEHFSMAYGVSIGGLVILSLYEKGWSAATCTFQLRTLAKEAFYKPTYLLFISFYMLKYIHLFLFGYLYPKSGIENVLKEVFEDKKMADPSYATAIGTKIGILTTSVEPPITHLFTNYNGIGGTRAGYVALKVRGTSGTGPQFANSEAAPEVHLPLQWLSEFSELTGDTTPDFVINLGTGSPSEPNMIAERPRGFWRTGWLPRLVHAYLSFLRGRRTWNDVLCLVKRTPRENGCYRLDITLEGTVTLDDTASMPLLRSLVLRDTALRDIIEELAQRLFAALFYFELTAIPATRSGSRFHIHGQILCTRKAGDPALPHILRRLSNSALLVDGREIRNKPAVDPYGNIQIILHFTARQCINLELKDGRSSPPFPLSGAPYTISKLVTRGGLAATFGTRSHKRKADLEMGGQPRRRRLC